MSSQVGHYRWNDQPLEHLRSGITRRFVTSERVMIGEVRFMKGDVVPAHSHVHEQFTHVVSGCLRFTLGAAGDEVVLVYAGEVIVIPSNLLHGVEALDDTLEYDVFNPPRQDWIDPDSAFLRA